MKILYFSQFYTPESIAPSFRATDNSKLWSKFGHDVTVFTGYPNYPIGKIFKGYKPCLLREEAIDGVRVIRSKLIAKPNTSTLKRLENALSFFFFGLVNVLFNRRKIGKGFEVVLGSSGVIFTAFLAWIAACVYHIPFVFELRDISYIQMQATGHRTDSFAVRGMKVLELFLCKRARMVVVVTNGFRQVLSKEGISPEKMVVITNGVDIDEEDTHSNYRGKFVLSYFGTLGISQNIIGTFEYAHQIEKIRDNFEYLIIGEGAQKQSIDESLSGGKYSYIRMLPGMSAQKLEKYYKCTEMSVVTLQKTENFKYTIPSKLFQIMGRGIAVLFIGPSGEASNIVNHYCAGLTLTGTLEEDIEKIKEFFEDEGWQEKIAVMGRNGKCAVKKQYSRKKLAQDYISILNQASARKEI